MKLTCYYIDRICGAILTKENILIYRLLKLHQAESPDKILHLKSLKTEKKSIYRVSGQNFFN